MTRFRICELHLVARLVSTGSVVCTGQLVHWFSLVYPAFSHMPPQICYFMSSSLHIQLNSSKNNAWAVAKAALVANVTLHLCPTVVQSPEYNTGHYSNTWFLPALCKAHTEGLKKKRDDAEEFRVKFRSGLFLRRMRVEDNKCVTEVKELAFSGFLLTPCSG